MGSLPPIRWELQNAICFRSKILIGNKGDLPSIVVSERFEAILELFQWNANMPGVFSGSLLGASCIRKA